MLQAKVTHLAILNNSLDLEAHVKQFFAQQLNMPRREIDDVVYVAKPPQSITARVKLSDHRFIFFVPGQKKHLRLSNARDTQ